MQMRFIFPAAAFMLLTGFGAARAADGVVEINQARALAGGVTASDDPGFPVTIDAPGSYVLTGPLEVASSTPGIQITANRVDLDLRGFTIEHSGTGTADLVTSAESGFHNVREVTIRNGTLLSAGNRGIFLGNFGNVIEVNVLGSGGHGIEISANALIRDSKIRFSAEGGIRAQSGARIIGNEVFGNGDSGISVQGTARVFRNVVNNNGGHGILANAPGFRIADNTVRANDISGISGQTDGLVVSNVARQNAIFGLDLGPGTGYRDNLLIGNQTDTVDEGIETGTNICDGDTVCP